MKVIVVKTKNEGTVTTANLITTENSDTRLRIRYLYQLLFTQSDEDHPLTTKQITDKMEELHGIHMHRTTVPLDIALLKTAGF